LRQNDEAAPRVEGYRVRAVNGEGKPLTELLAQDSPHACDYAALIASTALFQVGLQATPAGLIADAPDELIGLGVEAVTYPWCRGA
jgi:hypothetical protein